MIKMDKNAQNLDPRLIIAAEHALEEFRQGERILSDYNFNSAYAKGELLADFKSQTDAYGGDDDEILEFIGTIIDISADPERTLRILRRKEYPTAAELAKWGEYLSDSGETYMTDYVFVPLFHKEDKIGWTIIQEGGTPLAREYEITGIFATEAEMDKFFQDNFE